MAIAFMRAKIISRGNHQSAVACAAYRSGSSIRDELCRKTYNYGLKQGIIAAGIEAPEGAPAWALDREKLWNKVEAAEGRKDARLARELIVAIPHELPDEDKLMLTVSMAAHLAEMGMAVDWALHRPSKEGDQANFHAHLMLTTREITPDGFGSKSANSVSRTWNKKEWLDQQKTTLEGIANQALASHGLQPISFAALKGKGGEHLGPAKTEEVRKILREMKAISEQGDWELNAIEIQIAREMEEMHAAREAELKAEREPVTTKPAQRNPVQQLAEAVELARLGGVQEISNAHQFFRKIKAAAGGRLAEYPEIQKLGRSLARSAAKKGLIEDERTGELRAMTKREREQDYER